MHIESAQPRRRSLISLTPLIDVVFILLVFFMLASSFLDWRFVTLDLPGEGRASGAEPTALVIRIAADGALEVDGEPLELAELEAYLVRVLAQDPERLVLIRPADSVSLQRIVQVVDRLSAVGGQRMRLERGG